MTDISSDAYNRWWQKTHESTWESLRVSLDEILTEQIISKETYANVKWAVDKVENLGIHFPTSAAELAERLNYYL